MAKPPVRIGPLETLRPAGATVESVLQATSGASAVQWVETWRLARHIQVGPDRFREDWQRVGMQRRQAPTPAPPKKRGRRRPA